METISFFAKKFNSIVYGMAVHYVLQNMNKHTRKINFNKYTLSEKAGFSNEESKKAYDFILSLPFIEKAEEGFISVNLEKIKKFLEGEIQYEKNIKECSDIIELKNFYIKTAQTINSNFNKKDLNFNMRLERELINALRTIPQERIKYVLKHLYRLSVQDKTKIFQPKWFFNSFLVLEAKIKQLPEYKLG